MTRRTPWLPLLLCLLCLAPAALAEDEAGQTVDLPEVGIRAAFPAGWTVVTRETVADHLALLDDPTAEAAEASLRAEGVWALAFSPAGDVSLRVIAREEEGDAALYYDIDRYTAAMRTQIKDDFLNRELWALTGYRYTAADWTNREGQGRLLNLQYTVRSGEDIVARGRQVYTIRNGLAITLDMLVEGRKIETADERVLAAFVAGTALPVSEDMPLLPVGLKFTAVVPEETHRAELTIRGETTPGATVTAWVTPETGGDAVRIGLVRTTSGTFRLDAVLPGEGEWRLYVEAELEGMAGSAEGCWVSYVAKRIPVTFTSYPDGEYTGDQVIVSGKTIAGVSIQCMEGDTNKKTTTGSDGTFSFKMDRTTTGNRTITLAMSKNGYDHRRFELKFNRQWEREDFVKYLAGQVQSLSFENLSENAEKYLGRLVRYSGEVLGVSGIDERVYVELGVKRDKDGRWTQRIVAVSDGLEVLLLAGDSATLYFEVTGESYAFSEVNLDGDEITIDLPAVRLLTYSKD